MSSDSHEHQGGLGSSTPPRLAPGGGAAGGGSKNNNKNRRRRNNKARNKKSPPPSRQKGGENQQYHQRRQHRTPTKKKSGHKSPADMTVIVQRVDLWDIPAKAPEEQTSNNKDEHQYHNHFHVAPYHFAPDVSCWIPVDEDDASRKKTVAVMKAPRSAGEHELGVDGSDSLRWSVCESQVVDNSIPNPHPPDVVHDKYWAQRRRLFSRFDRGIQLDAEGWFSVTPQVIAHHVAARVGDLSNSTAFRRGLPGSDISSTQGIVVLDAFCGCGGNSIAFGKLPYELISLVISVDVDREKLRMAAHNASVYDIPRDKIIFVECNTMHIMEHCYKNGDRIQSTNDTQPAVRRELHAGYPIGGLELLPDRIDAVFMDPPWGGVDYGTLGKDGYDLEKHMKIRVGSEEETAACTPDPESQNDSAAVNGVGDDFFDTFTPAPTTAKTFTPKDEAGGEYINGLDLLKMAACATRSRLVIYDLPRNANKSSLGQAALAAGFRGNLKLEEHHLNGRLKTVTAYLGTDYSGLLH